MEDIPVRPVHIKAMLVPPKLGKTFLFIVIHRCSMPLVSSSTWVMTNKIG